MSRPRHRPSRNDSLLAVCLLLLLIVFTGQAFALTEQAINVSPIFTWSKRL